MCTEIALMIFALAMLLLVVACIPVLLKLRRAAVEFTITLQVLNERLPVIMKNMEDISGNVNASTSAVNVQVQKYAETADRFHGMIDGVAQGMERLSTPLLRSSLLNKIGALLPVIQGIRVFFNVLTGRQRV